MLRGHSRTALYAFVLSASLPLTAQVRPTPRPQPAARPSAIVNAVRLRNADAFQQTALNRLKADSATPLKVNLQRGVLRFAMFKIAVPADAGRDNDARAMWFLNRYRGALRLAEPAIELQLARRSRDGEHVFFRRRHLGIPVFPGVIGVHFNGATIRSVAGDYVTDIEVSPVPGITAQKAESLAKGYDKPEVAEVIGDTSLTYVNVGLLGFDDTSTHLAWQVNLTTGKTMYIDANSGSRLYVSQRVMSEFDLELDNRNNKAPRYSWPCGGDQDWFDENGVIKGASPDAEGFTAFNNIKKVYNYWWATFGRDSYDGDAEDIEVYVHTGMNWQQAHYVSGCDLFEFGDGFVTLDVMGHEYTHGVDENEGELEYCNEPGALDESFADVFGHFVQNADWLIGEGTPGAGSPSKSVAGCSGTAAARDMANPPCFGQPDTYSSPLKKSLANDPDKGNDFGGVHTNSGINNKAVYLLTAGGTFNGRKITGIGQYKAEQLMYAVHTAYLWDSSNMIDARNGAVSYADTWVNGKEHWFTADDLCSVRNAYAAVGLGAGDLDCDGVEDGNDADEDGDFVPNVSDNCPTVSNPGQEDIDYDGKGNACDPDIDGDNVPNTTDNCVYTKNPDQKDSDGDGKGDKCDDSDGDSIVDASDNCPKLANYNQKDTDGDGIGDACDSDIDGDGVPNAVDNCPMIANKDQTDSDGDGIGNACDLCPGLKSADNTDTDGDGKANPCDPDDDDDGVLDAADNCPFVPNPDQLDLNGNGIGLKCDPEELKMMNTIKNKVASMKTKAPAHIPVPICPMCGKVLPANLEAVVRVTAPFGSDVRIISSDGRSVADGRRGLTQQVLTFRPLPYGGSSADGMRYYLIVTPPPAIMKSGYEVTFASDWAVRTPVIRPLGKPALENHQ